jgi:lipoprotein-releasing system permease protein
LDLSLFISKKTSKPQAGTFSATIHKVAVVSISLGLAVMTLAFLIMLGFQNTIKNKIYDFTGHLQVTRYLSGNTYAQRPASLDSFAYNKEIIRIQPFGYKYGLLQNDDEVDGVIFKGVDHAFDTITFRQYLIDGRFIHFKAGGTTTEIVISKNEADKMQLKVGEDILMHFIQEPPRTRKLKVVGIYETGMEDLDDKLLIGDLNLVRRLNGWQNNQAGGYEIFLTSPEAVDEVYASLFDEIGYDLFVQKTSEKYIQIFEWLSLINNNVNILIFMVLFVASFNMISIVLILILERTNMIGTLKALGATDSLIRKVFIYSGVRLIVIGLIIGNIAGLGLAALQYYFNLIPLDASNYYMSYVPIEFNWLVIAALNLLIFMLVSAVLFIPTLFISRIQPIKAIRFD